MKYSAGALIMMVVLGNFPALAQESRAQEIPTQVERIDIVDFGIYTTEVSRVVDAPDSVSGSATSITRRSTELVSETERIPAALGTLFGFQYRVVGKPRNRMVPLQLTVKIPATKGYGTDTHAGRSVTHTVTPPISKKYFVGFGFQVPGEQVPGTWVMQLAYGDDVLAEKRFTVFLPGGPPLPDR